MRYPINLSSEPFRRDRPILIASGVVAGLMVVTLVLLVCVAVAERQRAAESRQAIGRTNAQLAVMAKEQAKLETVLRRPENAEAIEKTQFLNTLLIRKGVSWTKLFADLESVVPHNVRVISVRPQVDRADDLLLDMVVGAAASEPVLTLLMQLESSAVFGATTIHSWLPPTQTDPLYRYRVSVSYDQKL